jgi:hypothetical protein
LRRTNIYQAQISVFNAKNYRILKALHLTPAVKTLADEIITAIGSDWVEIEMMFNHAPGTPPPPNPLSGLREVEGKLQELERTMRSELQPTAITTT